MNCNACKMQKWAVETSGFIYETCLFARLYCTLTHYLSIQSKFYISLNCVIAPTDKISLRLPSDNVNTVLSIFLWLARCYCVELSLLKTVGPVIPFFVSTGEKWCGLYKYHWMSFLFAFCLAVTISYIDLTQFPRCFCSEKEGVGVAGHCGDVTIWLYCFSKGISRFLVCDPIYSEL